MRSEGLLEIPKSVEGDLYRLGLAIRNGRRERNMTQTQLAQRAKLSPTTVRSAEKGDPSVSAGVLIKLLWLVGIGPVSNVLIPKMKDWRDLENPEFMRVRSKRVEDDF